MKNKEYPVYTRWSQVPKGLYSQSQLKKMKVWDKMDKTIAGIIYTYFHKNGYFLYRFNPSDIQQDSL